MAQIAARPIGEIMGLQISQDRKHLVLGLRDQGGEEIILSFDSDDLLRKLLLVVLEGRGLFPLGKGLGEKTTSLIDTNWVEIGRVTDPGSSDFFISLFRQNGGHASFRIGRNSAQSIRDVMVSLLGPPDNSRNPQPGDLSTAVSGPPAEQQLIKDRDDLARRETGEK